MIRKWVLGNFKSISGSQSIDVAPLTILAGPNSAGKSTVIQSILLISQTLRSSRVERPLLMNGEFVQLGSVDDVFHSVPHDQESASPRPRRYLEIGFNLGIPDTDETFDIDSNEVFSSITGVELNLRFTKSKQITSHTLAGSPEIDRLVMNIETNSMPVDVDNESDGTMETRQSKLRAWPRRGTAGIPDQLDTEEIDTATRVKMSGYYDGYRSRGRLNDRVIGPSGSPFIRGMRGNTVDLTPFALESDRILPSRLVSHYSQHQFQIGRALSSLSSVLRRPRTSWASYISGLPSDFADQMARSLTALITGDSNLRARFGPDQIQEILGGKNSKVDRLAALLNILTLPIRRDLVDALSNRRQELLDQALLEQDQKALEPDLGISRNPLPEPFHGATDFIRRFFTTQLHYLGPLREEPRALYALPPSRDPLDIGLKGEYTAAVLDAQRNRSIEYWNPDLNRIVTGTLKDAVQIWLLHLEMAESVNTQEAGKLGYALTIRKAGVSKDLDLTNVGVGVSQVLPILVMGLLASADSTLIYEQPEIHLHPKIQSQIADFFIGLMHCQKQCIVETHSEYIINRIRRRIAESPNDVILGNTNMLFVENRAGRSNFRKVQINEYGAINDWPDDFFDESQLEADRIIAAVMTKRRTESHE